MPKSGNFSPAFLGSLTPATTMTGSGNVVLTKIMDDKIKDMAEEVSKSPDYIHIKKVKKNPENVHVHMKHKRKGMDWDR